MSLCDQGKLGGAWGWTCSAPASSGQDATPQNIGPDRLNLGIVAVGGTAAVSEATMEAALQAASSTDALTVRIGAASDTNKDGATNADDPVRPDPATAGTATAIDATASPATGPMINPGAVEDAAGND